MLNIAEGIITLLILIMLNSFVNSILYLNLTLFLYFTSTEILIMLLIMTSQPAFLRLLEILQKNLNFLTFSFQFSILSNTLLCCFSIDQSLQFRETLQVLIPITPIRSLHHIYELNYTFSLAQMIVYKMLQKLQKTISFKLLMFKSCLFIWLILSIERQILG